MESLLLGTITISGCLVARGTIGPAEEEPPEMLLAGVVLHDVELTREVHVAYLALHVLLPGDVGHLAPVLPTLLVLLEVEHRHAPHVADTARDGERLG